VWRLINEPFALRSPAIKAGHLGGGGGLIDEDKFLRIKGLLLFPQGPAGRRDIGPVLFGGVHALFFKGQVDVVEEPRNCRLAHRHLFFRQAISKLRKRTIRLFRYKLADSCASRTVIPIHRGQPFQSIADSIPVIADSF
jgi:hypothetical protein